MRLGAHGRRALGFTLVEVMIASAIGVVMLTLILTTFDTTERARAVVTRTNETFQTGQFAMGTLRTDLELAGFYGHGTVTAAVPSPAPSPCSTTPTDWTNSLPLPVQAWLAESADRPSCLPTSLVANSSILVIRRAATCVVGTANCATGSSGTPMVQVSECDTQTTRAVAGNTQGTGTPLVLTARNCTTLAPVRQYLTRIYYLDQNNVSGDGNRTLKRLDLTSSGISSENSVTVAQGVQQMRVVYGLDDVGSDGVPDNWVSAPTAAQWPDVVSASINLLVRGTEREINYVDSRSYQVGDITISAANDNYRRRLVSTNVRLVNVAGRREIPQATLNALPP